MDAASLIGIISGLALIIGAIFIGGDLQSFINVQGMMIVFGGTLAATLITFSLKMLSPRSWPRILFSPKKNWTPMTWCRP